MVKGGGIEEEDGELVLLGEEEVGVSLYGVKPCEGASLDFVGMGSPSKSEAGSRISGSSNRPSFSRACASASSRSTYSGYSVHPLRRPSIYSLKVIRPTMIDPPASAFRAASSFERLIGVGTIDIGAGSRPASILRSFLIFSEIKRARAPCFLPLCIS